MSQSNDVNILSFPPEILKDILTFVLLSCESSFSQSGCRLYTVGSVGQNWTVMLVCNKLCFISRTILESFYDPVLHLGSACKRSRLESIAKLAPSAELHISKYQGTYIAACAIIGGKDVINALYGSGYMLGYVTSHLTKAALQLDCIPAVIQINKRMKLISDTQARRYYMCIQKLLSSIPISSEMFKVLSAEFNTDYYADISRLHGLRSPLSLLLDCALQAIKNQNVTLLQEIMAHANVENDKRRILRLIHKSIAYCSEGCFRMLKTAVGDAKISHTNVYLERMLKTSSHPDERKISFTEMLLDTFPDSLIENKLLCLVSLMHGTGALELFKRLVNDKRLKSTAVVGCNSYRYPDIVTCSAVQNRNVEICKYIFQNIYDNSREESGKPQFGFQSFDIISALLTRHDLSDREVNKDDTQTLQIVINYLIANERGQQELVFLLRNACNHNFRSYIPVIIRAIKDSPMANHVLQQICKEIQHEKIVERANLLFDDATLEVARQAALNKADTILVLDTMQSESSKGDMLEILMDKHVFQEDLEWFCNELENRFPQVAVYKTCKKHLLEMQNNDSTVKKSKM